MNGEARASNGKKPAPRNGPQAGSPGGTARRTESVFC